MLKNNYYLCLFLLTSCFIVPSDAGNNVSNASFNWADEPWFCEIFGQQSLHQPLQSDSSCFITHQATPVQLVNRGSLQPKFVPAIRAFIKAMEEAAEQSACYCVSTTRPQRNAQHFDREEELVETWLAAGNIAALNAIPERIAKKNIRD